MLVFGVPLRGSLPLLVLICLLSSLAFASLGLLIASRAQTMEGASGLMNLVMLPMWIFSGVFFSSCPLSRADPAVHSGAAAHGGDQCPAGEHASRRRLEYSRARARDYPRDGWW